MGLDMYLYKKLYVKNWDHMRPEERHTITIKKGNNSEYPKHVLDPGEITYIVSESGYWRKANQIHNWFVNNVQDGKDDCGSYHVSKNQLEELLGTVNKVLAASKLVPGKVTNGYTFDKNGQRPIVEDGMRIADPTVAQELLPTQSGFFFGSTDFDQWYYDELKRTKEILERALEDDHSMFEYQSSW